MQTIHRQTIFPLNNLEKISIYASDGNFRAIIVEDGIDQYTIGQMIAATNPTHSFSNYIAAHNAQYSLIVEPEESSVSIRVVKGVEVMNEKHTEPVVQRAQYADTNTAVSWWNGMSTTYKWIIGIITILIIAMIIGAIVITVRKNKGSNISTNSTSRLNFLERNPKNSTFF